MCVGESRQDDNLLCSDGETADFPDGCFSRGSISIQCPKDYHPCNNFRPEANYHEFECQKDCDDYGGYKRLLSTFYTDGFNEFNELPRY